MALALAAATCSNPTDVCTPQESSFGFFSKGDCVLTRASFFQGHEWLTFFGNLDLPPEDRFTAAEVKSIAEGNRRVDWPKEMLVHLNVSLFAYINALTEYTDRPEIQRLHFLLTDRNGSAEAAKDSHDTIKELTIEGASVWVSNRERALTLFGKCNHILQDSFSQAHTLREPDHPTNPWCIRRVKAFAPRKPGFETYADGTKVLFHGGETDDDGRGISDDSIGHTTTDDSIYREGRDCHDPTTPGVVESCFTPEATRARLATRDYLAAVREIVRTPASGQQLEDIVVNEMDAYIEKHLSLCPDP